MDLGGEGRLAARWQVGAVGYFFRGKGGEGDAKADGIICSELGTVAGICSGLGRFYYALIFINNALLC